MMFRVLWCIDAILVLVFAYFFVTGIADGSVSSFNMALWLCLLLGLGGVLLGSHALQNTGRTRFAISLLMVIAVPGVAVGLLFLVLLIFSPQWN